jgi:hypothetical protein
MQKIYLLVAALLAGGKVRYLFLDCREYLRRGRVGPDAACNIKFGIILDANSSAG